MCKGIKRKAMNINSHEEARQVLIAGFKIRNIRYSEEEWLELKDELTTEDGYTHGLFDGEFWQLQLRLPERWSLVDTKSDIKKKIEKTAEDYADHQIEYNEVEPYNYSEMVEAVEFGIKSDVAKEYHFKITLDDINEILHKHRHSMIGMEAFRRIQSDFVNLFKDEKDEK